MRFIIKPDDPSLDTFLATAHYQRIWKQYSRKVLRGMRETTGLKFQQTTITARVRQGEDSRAGYRHYAMILAADYQRSEADRIITLIHELGHHLLSGNYLDLRALGLQEEDDNGTNDDYYIEMTHRHPYLFEYDVVRNYLGPELAKTCVQHETIHKNGPHAHAWDWAMSMTYEERQRALKILTAKTMTLVQWQALKDTPITPMDPDAWFRQLNAKAKPKIHKELSR